MTATGLEPTTTYFVNKHSTIWPNLVSLAKWLSVRLRNKWLWVRVPLQLNTEFGTNVFRKWLKKQRKETNKDVIVSQWKVLYYRNCVGITVSTISVSFCIWKLLYFILHLRPYQKILNNVLQKSKKLNVPTEINAIINFYNISKMLIYNITESFFQRLHAICIWYNQKISLCAIWLMTFALISFFKSKKFKMEKIKHVGCACVSLMF